MVHPVCLGGMIFHAANEAAARGVCPCAHGSASVGPSLVAIPATHLFNGHPDRYETLGFSVEDVVFIPSFVPDRPSGPSVDHGATQKTHSRGRSCQRRRKPTACSGVMPMSAETGTSNLHPCSRFSGHESETESEALTQYPRRSSIGLLSDVCQSAAKRESPRSQPQLAAQVGSQRAHKLTKLWYTDGR